MESPVTDLPYGLMMAPAEGGSPLVAILIQLGLIVLIFYWLLIRPQRRERERHSAMIAALKKGDEISTVGGIIGTVVHVEEDRLTIKTAENTRVTVERGKVSRTMGAGKEEQKR
jgi:preprotein translocase subunit YajC